MWGDRFPKCTTTYKTEYFVNCELGSRKVRRQTALLGQGGDAQEKVSEDEIHSLVREAETAGVLEPGEKEMIAAVMRLSDRPVGAVMTPRPDVQIIDQRDDPEAIREAFASSPLAENISST